MAATLRPAAAWLTSFPWCLADPLDSLLNENLSAIGPFRLGKACFEEAAENAGVEIGARLLLRIGVKGLGIQQSGTMFARVFDGRLQQLAGNATAPESHTNDETGDGPDARFRRHGT